MSQSITVIPGYSSFIDKNNNKLFLAEISKLATGISPQWILGKKENGDFIAVVPADYCKKDYGIRYTKDDKINCPN